MDEDDEENMYISRQTFVNIGVQMAAMAGDPEAIMLQVFDELIALHECRRLKPLIIKNVETCRGDVGPKQIRSVDSELFSLCSTETDDTVFKYYISSDNDNDNDNDDDFIDPELKNN
jgi:hypothetical protein